MTLAEKFEQRGMQRGIQQGMLEGLQLGKLEAAIDIAKKLLQQGMPIAQIALVTGISEEQIETLKN